MQTKPEGSKGGHDQPQGRSQGRRPLLQYLLRGAYLRCPACGQGAMFGRYLKVADTCANCAEELTSSPRR